MKAQLKLVGGRTWKTKHVWGSDEHFEEFTIFKFWLEDTERREALITALKRQRLPVWPAPYDWKNSEPFYIALCSIYGMMKLGQTLDEALQNTKWKTWGYIEERIIENPHFPSTGRYDREVKGFRLRQEIPKVMEKMEEFERRLKEEL